MIFEKIKDKVFIEKGWSPDKKYLAVADTGEKFLLRISPHEKLEYRRKLFGILKELSLKNISMNHAIEMGICSEGVYTIFSFIDGSDAEDVIPLLQIDKQYQLGIDGGKMLKEIHSIPAPEDTEDWHSYFNKKTDKKIEKYLNCGIKFDGDDKILSYLAKNRDLFLNRPLCFQHGDYHIGNMMIENEKLVVIDFDRYDFGDPWEEFNRIVWCAQASPSFASGIIDGYFDSNVPLLFWKCLAFYIAANTLSSIYWAIDFGQSEINTMLNQSKDVLSWYDNFENVVPTWYKNI